MSKPRRAWEPPLFEWSMQGPIPITLTDEIVDNEGDKLAGVSLVYEREIALDSALPDVALRVTLMHEWLHLWCHDSGFEWGKLEEQFIQSLASALIAREDFHAAGGVPEAPVPFSRI